MKFKFPQVFHITFPFQLFAIRFLSIFEFKLIFSTNLNLLMNFTKDFKLNKFHKNMEIFHLPSVHIIIFPLFLVECCQKQGSFPFLNNNLHFI
jgi:hypothetical protein